MLQNNIYYSELFTHMHNATIWYTSKVFRGDQRGRQIQFPTINLDPSMLDQQYPQGIYASIIKHETILYQGALYLGPRLVLGETNTSLEIYIFNFDKEIYDEVVSFQIKKFIRPIANFSSMEALKEQIEKDKKNILSYFLKNDSVTK